MEHLHQGSLGRHRCDRPVHRRGCKPVRARPLPMSCLSSISPLAACASGGITSDPNGEWMKQVARNLTDMWDGFLLGKRYLIHDRDPLFTEAVHGLLRDSGVKPLRLPANSPNLNAYAERFVLSIRRECLDRFVPLSERHLRTAVTEYVVHYHTERNHQGLGNELITPLPASANDAGPIVSRERLGGILNYYCRAA